MTAVTPTAPPASAWNFEQIYAEFGPRIFNHIYRHVNNRELAEDLTQDVFLRAFKDLPNHDASLRLSPWLYRIATNATYDALRHRKLITWHRLEDLDTEPADECSAIEQEEPFDHEAIACALEAISERHRIALLLFVQHGPAWSLIVRHTGCTPGSVRMYLHRAKMAFRAEYTKLTQADGGFSQKITL